MKIRNHITTYGNIYCVKTNKWPIGWWSCRWNRRINPDIFIISNPKEWKKLNYDPDIRMCFLHELGHIHKKYRWFWLDEIMASVNGFKYRKELEANVTVWDLIKHIWWRLKYIFLTQDKPQVLNE